MGFRLDHRFTQKNLSAYLDGRLTASERERVERHVAACSRCQEELATLRSTVELLHEVPSVPLPRSFALSASAEEERERYRFWRRMHTALRTATAVVSLLLVLLLSSDLAMSLGFVPLPRQAAKTAPQKAVVETKVVEAPEVAKAYIPAPSPTAAAERMEADAIPSPSPHKEAEAAAEKEAPRVLERPAGGGSPEWSPTPTKVPAEPQVKMLEKESLQEGPEAPSAPATTTPKPPTPTPPRPPELTATMTPLPARDRPATEPTRFPYWRIWGWARTGWAALSGLLLVLVAGLLWTWQKRQF